MRKWGKKQRKREGMKYSHKLIKKKGSLAIQRKRKRTESGKNTNKRLQKDTITKRDRVCMATREKYLSSTITVNFPPPSIPSPDSKHQNRRHTQELRLRKRNLSDQAIYLPSSDRRNCHR